MQIEGKNLADMYEENSIVVVAGYLLVVRQSSISKEVSISAS